MDWSVLLRDYLSHYINNNSAVLEDVVNQNELARKRSNDIDVIKNSMTSNIIDQQQLSIIRDVLTKITEDIKDVESRLETITMLSNLRMITDNLAQFPQYQVMKEKINAINEDIKREEESIKVEIKNNSDLIESKKNLLQEANKHYYNFLDEEGNIKDFSLKDIDELRAFLTPIIIEENDIASFHNILHPLNNKGIELSKQEKYHMVKESSKLQNLREMINDIVKEKANELENFTLSENDINLLREKTNLEDKEKLYNELNKDNYWKVFLFDWQNNIEPNLKEDVALITFLEKIVDRYDREKLFIPEEVEEIYRTNEFKYDSIVNNLSIKEQQDLIALTVSLKDGYEDIDLLVSKLNEGEFIKNFILLSNKYDEFESIRELYKESRYDYLENGNSTNYEDAKEVLINVKEELISMIGSFYEEEKNETSFDDTKHNMLIFLDDSVLEKDLLITGKKEGIRCLKEMMQVPYNHYTNKISRDTVLKPFRDRGIIDYTDEFKPRCYKRGNVVVGYCQVGIEETNLEELKNAYDIDLDNHQLLLVVGMGINSSSTYATINRRISSNFGDIRQIKNLFSNRFNDNTRLAAEQLISSSQEILENKLQFNKTEDSGLKRVG